MALTRSAFVVSHQPGGQTIIQNLDEHPGAVYFVDSATGSDATGNGLGPDTPLATLAKAVALCTAAKGDTIYLMPGHAEKISTATALDLNVAGIRVIGLGHGALKPTLTLDTANTSTVTISAKNVLVRNVRFVANFLNIAAMITVTGTGPRIEKCELLDTSSILNALIGISIADAMTDLLIEDCRIWGTATGNTHAIKALGTMDNAIIRRNSIMGTHTTASLAATVSASKLVEISDNRMHNADSSNGLCVSLHASTTGMIVGNRLHALKQTVTPLVAAGAVLSDNLTLDVVNKSGLLKPAATAFS
jgi:hypothetical protein